MFVICIIIVLDYFNFSINIYVQNHKTKIFFQLVELFLINLGKISTVHPLIEAKIL